MIRSMDLRMAVGTPPVEIPDSIEQCRRRRMTAGDVTGITHTGHPDLEQLRVVGSVRFVTIRAILHDRWMLPEKWAAPFGMAGQTVFRYSRLNQLFRIRTTVRIVATGASNFAFAIRHVRRALELCF